MTNESQFEWHRDMKALKERLKQAIESDQFWHSHYSAERVREIRRLLRDLKTKTAKES